MKKIVQILGCLALGTVVLTGCVKNEESDGVKSIREAEARYRNAEAVGLEIKNDIDALELRRQTAAYDISLEILIAQKKAQLADTLMVQHKAEGTNTVISYKKEIDEIRVKIAAINKDLYGEDGTAGGYTTDLATISNSITDKNTGITAQEKIINDETSTAAQKATAAKELVTLKADKAALEAQKSEVEKLIANKGTEITALQKQLDKLIAEISAL